ncbi:hypothetical protein [Chryseobacterium sp.]
MDFLSFDEERILLGINWLRFFSTSLYSERHFGDSFFFIVTYSSFY